MGRHAYAMGDPDWYVDHYEFQVPIFVLTHAVPEKLPKQNERLTFTFVTDGVERAIAQAKAAARDKQVMGIGGANSAEPRLRAGLVDEIQIGIIPVQFGEGLRFFEHLGPKYVELERLKVIESPTRTDLLFRVLK